MHLMFSTIRATDSKLYIEDRLAHWAPVADDGLVAPNPPVSEILAHPANPKLVSMDALPPPPPGADAMRECALGELKRQLPLLAGETVVSEGFTCLAEGYGGQAAGTMVYTRSTDMADLFVLFPNTQSDLARGMLSMRMPNGVETEVEIEAPPVILEASAYGKLITDLLAAMLKGAGLAGLVPFVDFLLNSHTSGFNYEKIAELFEEKLTKNTVNEVDGQLIGHFTWMTSDYLREKEVGTDPERLLDMLRSESRKMHDLIGTLRQGAFARAGLPVFLLGATGHLALIQEMEVLRAAHPALASFPGEPADLRKIYHDHATSTWEAISAKRNKLCAVERDDFIASEKPIVIVKGYRFRDKVTGHLSKTWHDHKDKKSKHHSGSDPCDRARKAYIEPKITALHTAIGSPKDQANSWLKLP